MCFLSSKTLVYHVWPQNSTWAKEIPACKKRVQVCSFDYLFTIFFSIYWNELVAKFFSQAEVELTIWVQTQQGAEILCSHFAVSCGSEPVSGLSWELLYCCSLFSFFFLKLSCSNLVLTRFESHFHDFGALGICQEPGLANMWGPGTSAMILACV